MATARPIRKHVIAADYGAKPNPKLPLSTNAELFPNGGLWAYDNWIYSAAYMKKFRYRDGKFETAPTIFRGQWGFTQDDYGRFYYNDNTHSLHGDIIFGDYLQRNPNYPRLEGTNVNIAADEAGLARARDAGRQRAAVSPPASCATAGSSSSRRRAARGSTAAICCPSSMATPSSRSRSAISCSARC